MNKTSTLIKLLESISETASDAADDHSLKSPEIQDDLNPPDDIIQFLMNYSRAIEAFPSLQTGWVWLGRN